MIIKIIISNAVSIFRRLLAVKQGVSWFVILLAALGLRLISLNQPLWLDEAIQWWAVKSFSLRELLTGYMVGDFNPPGYHLLMWFWVRIFGESEIALRLPSVIFGVGVVWFVYKIVSLLRSDLASQGQAFPELAAGMAAVNGLLIYYSQEARMYAMAAFFVSGAMYWFLKMNKTNKTDKVNGTNYAIYCLFLAAALYSHYLTWLMLPFLAIWGLRYVLPVLLTVSWWPMLWKQLQAGMSAAGNPVWADLSRTNFKNLALVAVKFVTGRVAWPEAEVGQIAVGGVVLAFWAAVIIGGIRVISPSTRLTLRRPPTATQLLAGRSQRASVRGSDFRLILVLWAFGPVVLGSLIGLIIPVFTYFRFLFAVPAVVILAAMPQTMLTSARGLHPRSRRAQVRGSDAPAIFPVGKIGIIRRILGMCLSGVMLVFSMAYLFNSNNHREDWRGAVGELRRLAERPVVLIHPAVRPPFDYYDQRSEIRDQRSVVIERSNLAAARLDLINPEIWYIPYAQPIFDPDDTARKELSNLGYVRTYERHFRGVTLERWTNVDSIARRIF